MGRYAVNPLSRPMLITPDECTSRLPAASLDSKKWISAIPIAEVRLIIPVLGYNLYNDICNQKNVQVTSGNQATLQGFINQTFGTDQAGNPKVLLNIGDYVNSISLVTVGAPYVALWNSALWDFVFNCVYFIALSENYAQFTNQGIQKNNPIGSLVGEKASSSVGIDLKDLRYLNDRWLLDRINPFQDYLEQYLCANISSLPLYPSKKCQKWNRETMEKRTTEFINIYSDDDCGCRKNEWSGQQILPVPPTPNPFKLTCTISIEVVSNPDPNQLYQLCNLQTILLQYSPSIADPLNPLSKDGDFITLPNLVGAYVNSAGMTKNGNPVNIPFDTNTGKFGSVGGAWFSDGDNFEFLYAQVM